MASTPNTVFDEIWNDSRFRGAVWSEVVITAITAVLALLGVWNLFAAMAFVGVILPIWLIAAAVILIAVHALESPDAK